MIKLNAYIPLSTFDIFAFTETWLTSNVNSSELGFKNFNVFRCDRNIHTSNLSRGGGVLIAVNNKLSSKLINITSKNLEIVFILIKTDRNNIIISSVYIPNRSTIGIFEEYFNIVNNIRYDYPSSDLILLGDFNIPSAISSHTKSLFFDNISLLNMTQFNNIVNSKNNILDYVISNNNSIKVFLSEIPIVDVDSYHPPLEINCETLNYNVDSIYTNEILYNWSKANYRLINSDLGSINWLNLLHNTNDINYNISTFYSIIISIIYK